MKIEFYHVDAFEAANYEPIWRALISLGVDARMVAVPDNQNTAASGWFDYERFEEYCHARQIPFSTAADGTAEVGVTTQNADILANYHKRVRLMYGPVMYPHAWALQPHSVQPFDAVLTHGQAYVDFYSQWLPKEKLPIMGYPRYDDFFSGKLKKDEICQQWGFDNSRPIIAFLPTWDNNTAFDIFFPHIMRLATEFNIIVRPHHCTLRLEPKRMALLLKSGLKIVDNAFDLSSIYQASDLVISDVRSGGLFEACLCRVPTVGLVIDPSEITGWLAAMQVHDMVSLCANPADLNLAIHHALHSTEQALNKQLWANHYVAHQNGQAAMVAAQALIKIAEGTS